MNQKVLRCHVIVEMHTSVARHADVDDLFQRLTVRNKILQVIGFLLSLKTAEYRMPASTRS